MGTAVKHPVPDRIKLSFIIFDIPALWRSGSNVRVAGCQKLQNGGLTGLADKGCYIAVLWQQWASKGQNPRRPRQPL